MRESRCMKRRRLWITKSVFSLSVCYLGHVRLGHEPHTWRTYGSGPAFVRNSVFFLFRASGREFKSCGDRL